MKGIVKSFDKDIGCGIIVGEDNHEYKFHYNDLPPELRLKKDDHVVFDAEENERGLFAEMIALDEGQEFWIDEEFLENMMEEISEDDLENQSM